MAKHSFDLHPLSAVLGATMISILAVFLWLAFTPHLPSFQVTSVNVTSLSTTTGGELTATFHVDGALGNPNFLLSHRYESLDIALWFDHRNISSAPVEPLPFSTGAETDTPVRARFAVARKLFPGGVVRGIAEQRGRGSVDFGVTLLARLRFTWGIVRTGVRTLTVECFPLHVVFPPDNNYTGSGLLKLSWLELMEGSLWYPTESLKPKLKRFST
ncbi:hypothetical protein E2542_SST24678 [Spatholobus suberectus]|nr:hypothetical protein E2542_SST24678 [Spatholobus suberectus]